MSVDSRAASRPCRRARLHVDVRHVVLGAGRLGRGRADPGASPGLDAGPGQGRADADRDAPLAGDASSSLRRRRGRRAAAAAVSNPPNPNENLNASSGGRERPARLRLGRLVGLRLDERVLDETRAGRTPPGRRLLDGRVAGRTPPGPTQLDGRDRGRRILDGRLVDRRVLDGRVTWTDASRTARETRLDAAPAAPRGRLHLLAVRGGRRARGRRGRAVAQLGTTITATG